jgi:hypothetical protein
MTHSLTQVLRQTTLSIATNIFYPITKLGLTACKVTYHRAGIRATWLPIHPTHHLFARNGNLDKAVAVHIVFVAKGPKHGLCTLSKVKKREPPQTE